MNLKKYFLSVFVGIFCTSNNCIGMDLSGLPELPIKTAEHVNTNSSKLPKPIKENKYFAPIRNGVKSNVHDKRQLGDFYATNPHTVELFLNKIKDDGIILPETIYEPACGQGHISKELEKHGYNVISSNLYDYGYGNSGKNFLESTQKVDCFFTNPPFKLALKFMEKSIKNLNSGGKSIMYLKLNYLSGKKRGQFFKLNPPKYVYIHSSRQVCARNGDFSQYKDKKMIDYAWFIWEKDFQGDTIVRWIP